MNASIKILYVHHGSGNSGAANSLVRMLQELDQNVFGIFVACDFRKPSAKLFFEQHGFPPIDLPAAMFSHVAGWWPLYTPRGVAKTLEWMLVKQPLSLRKLQKVLQQTRPDIVHLNSLTIAPLAPMIKRQGIPVVLHVREPVAAGTFGFRRLWLRHLAKHYADQVIYICRDNQDRLTGPMKNALVLYNPIPFNKFDKEIDGKAIRRMLGIPKNAQVLFFPGGSSFGIKGIFSFLRALPIVREQKKDILAIVPGIDGIPNPRHHVRQRINEMISELGLENVIVRAPFTNAVESYYAASDIVMSPFIKAHFSLAVIEAGAMAKPVIGSKIGGIEEVLTNGENGFLVEPSNEGMLAEKILELIENKDLAATMGMKGYSQSRRLCDARQYAQHVADLYAQVYSDQSQRER